jgi:hypothetical protein
MSTLADQLTALMQRYCSLGRLLPAEGEAVDAGQLALVVREMAKTKKQIDALIGTSTERGR